VNRALKSHFRGTISDLREVPERTKPRADSCNLATMARAALNYLRGNPDPARNYECKFTLGPLGIPCHFPEWAKQDEYGYDPISLGDTDARMAMQYAHMREMAGVPDPDAVERGVIARVLGYLREDNYAWINPAAYVGKHVDGLYVGTWTTGKALYVLSEAWLQTGEEAARRKARQVFEALRDLAQWDGERAWYMGIAPWRDGQWLMDGWCEQHGRNYPFIVEPLVRYWECTGDEDALHLACAFAEGFLAGSQPDMRAQRIDPQSGAFQGHVHLHTHGIWGVAHLGAVLNDRRYLDWVRKAYEFVVASGTDYGWHPEFIPQQRYVTEICVDGDMASLAAWLARGGEPHYWDHLERTARNELRRSQFALTPEFLELFERLHRDKPADVVGKALAELRKLEGGFVAQAAFDDWVGYPSAEMGQAGIARNGIQMMGCCPPEGMRGLYEAWAGTVEESGDGRVYVNMAFTRNHPAARVRASSPADGRLDVTAGQAGTFHVRPPAWAERDRVTACRNGAQQPVAWGGPASAYVVFENVKKGDTLALRWPVPAFTQTFVPTSIPDKRPEVRVQWVGNEVQAVEPPGEYLRMFRPEAAED